MRELINLKLSEMTDSGYVLANQDNKFILSTD